MMKETSKHDPISKTHSMLFLSGTWRLSGSTQYTYWDTKIFDILDIFSFEVKTRVWNITNNKFGLSSDNV